LQVWRGVLNTSDLDDVLLIRNVKIVAEGKLDEILSEVLRVLPNLVEVRYFTTPTPPLGNYERCSVQKRSERLSEIRFRRTWHVRFGKHVGRATYKPPYPNNEDLQV
jgi:hypothetical protein